MRVIERKFITLSLHNEALRQRGKSLSKNTNKSLEFIPSCLKRLIKEYKYSGKHHILSDNQPHVCFALMCSGLRDKLLRRRILKLVQAYELPSMRTSFMRFFLHNSYISLCQTSVNLMDLYHYFNTFNHTGNNAYISSISDEVHAYKCIMHPYIFPECKVLFTSS